MINQTLFKSIVKDIMICYDSLFTIIDSDSFYGTDPFPIGQLYPTVKTIEKDIDDSFGKYNITLNDRKYFLKELKTILEKHLSNQRAKDLPEYYSNLVELMEYTKEELNSKGLREEKNGIMELKKHEKVFPEKSEISPIKLELDQTQIVFLFLQLLENGLINVNKNPKLWNSISLYFQDKDGRNIKNIHQTKDKLKNSKTGKPKRISQEIESIVKAVKNN